MIQRLPVLVLVLAAACRDGAPIEDLPLRVTAGAREVELGKAFPLTVVRVWRRERAPPEWNEEALSPLVVRLVEGTRREDDRLVEETRRYDAYAFSLEDVEVSGLALEVRRALDPADPGPAELPGDPLPVSFPRLVWWAAGAAALALFVPLLRRRRKPAPPPVPAPPPLAPPAPHLRALERIERLRGRRPRTRGELQAYYVEASGLLREYAGERFAVGAARMTTNELVAVVRAPRLAEVLDHCDLVKFARHEPADAERERMLEVAEAFVRETA